MHTLVLGTTGGGKSTYCKWLAEGLRKARKHVVLFNPYNQPGWNYDFASSNPDEVLKYCHQPFPKYVFLEEVSSLNADEKYDWFTTFSRNCHCQVWVIAQRMTKMISPNLRTNCEEVVLFKSSLSDCRELADEYREPRILRVEKFRVGEFYHISAFKPLQTSRLPTVKGLDGREKIKWDGKHTWPRLVPVSSGKNDSEIITET